MMGTIKLLNKEYLSLLLTALSFVIAFSQNDDLISESFDMLEEKFEKNEDNKLLAIEYANAYLKKAKKSNDTIKIANGYYFFTQIYLDPLYSEGIKYCDSIIKYTKNIKGNNKFPTLGYKEKGRYYYRYGLYKKALDNYIIAMNYSENNPLLHETINFNIGLIKNNIEEREEAREIFKRYINFLEIERDKKPIRSYNLALYALADNYNYTNKLDSAETFINKGIKNALKTNDEYSYKYFVFSSGINSVLKKNYRIAIDSLLKADSLFVGDYDRTSHAITKFYLGKSLLALKNNKQAINYLKSVDSILQNTNDVTPELLEAYNILINYYRENNNTENQIYYISELLKFDSILNTNHRYLSKKIIKSYDIKNLIAQKNSKIIELNNDKSSSKKTIIILFFCVLFLSLLIYHIVKKNINQKKKFDLLLKDLNEKKKVKESFITIDNESIKVSTRDIPEEVISGVLIKLEKFENSNRFAQKKYTLQSLAKEMNTNSNYLSKIINEYKEVNFSNYLNNLRIDYAINELTTNSKFRDYTIKAIAEDCGFKTQQSFAAAFYKKTGLKPSYFIKELKQEKNNLIC